MEVEYLNHGYVRVKMTSAQLSAIQYALKEGVDALKVDLRIHKILRYKKHQNSPNARMTTRAAAAQKALTAAVERNGKRT